MTDLSWIQTLGVCLLSFSLGLLKATFDSPQVDKPAPSVQEAPRLEAIRRWQSQEMIDDDGELWWVSAAKTMQRNPADDVNPPRIPPKRVR